MTAAKEHVSEAERTIRTIKERTRGLLATLPFSHIPRRMKIEFVYFIVLWLNAFPIKSGISSTFSPRELLVRWRSAAPTVDDTVYRCDKTMTTTSKEELHVWAYIMTQYNLKPGLSNFGQRGQTAAIKELTQLHVMDTWKPIHAEKLTREEKMKALLSLLFLKEKRTGDIKGRACINGAPQRSYISKEDAASPTVSTESTFITASIAAHERQVVRCYDVPSAFVNTDVDKEVIMVLKGDLAEMMIQVAPEVYRKCVAVDKKGTKILYVKLQKALYGLMRASLLFYRKLRKE